MDKTIELVNNVKDIHAMPSVIVKALNIMKKPTASMKELGDIVMYDQSLTIKILALVNSAYYGFSQQGERFHRKNRLARAWEKALRFHLQGNCKCKLDCVARIYF